MKGRWWAGLASVALMTATLAPPVVSPLGAASSTVVGPGARAMWVWGQQAPDEVIAWANAQNVTEIFAYAASTVATDGSLPRLRELSSRAASAGIKLRALGGEPGWATDHANALAWQKAMTATGLFSGIHLDVEPYLTSGWISDQEATKAGYLSMLDKMRGSLPVETDVPFWFGQFKVGGKNLADEVLKRVSAVTVMSYRDTATGPNSIFTISQDWLKRGTATGKKVRLGAEIDPIADCAYCSFAEEGARRMTAVLAQVDTAARTSPAYAGVAVHRYSSWRVLRP
jgi:hypothetical protein